VDSKSQLVKSIEALGDKTVDQWDMARLNNTLLHLEGVLPNAPNAILGVPLMMA
jgi:hypothetical protein